MSDRYKFRRKVVSVQVYDAKIPISSLCLDEFAIHGTLNADGIPSKFGYTVTHVYTGYALAKLWKQSSARKLVEDIADLGLNWQFDDPDAIPDEVWAQAKPVIQRYISNPSA